MNDSTLDVMRHMARDILMDFRNIHDAYAPNATQLRTETTVARALEELVAEGAALELMHHGRLVYRLTERGQNFIWPKLPKQDFLTLAAE